MNVSLERPVPLISIQDNKTARQPAQNISYTLDWANCTLSVLFCDRDFISLRLQAMGDNFSKHSVRNLWNIEMPLLKIYN